MKVLVYGTLKRGYGNNRLLQRHNAKFVEEKTIPGYILYYSHGEFGFPVARPMENSFIKGEVWDITDSFKECVRDLDFLESEGYMYNRTEVEENLFMYVGHPDNWPYKEMTECPSENNVYTWWRE